MQERYESNIIQIIFLFPHFFSTKQMSFLSFQPKKIFLRETNAWLQKWCINFSFPLFCIQILKLNVEKKYQFSHLRVFSNLF